MTPNTPSAARYFPFRIGPDADRAVRDAPEIDRDEQSKAARRASSHTLLMAAARPLWVPPPILLSFYVATKFWWIAVTVTAVCVLAGTILYGIARRARDDIRLLDGTIGIPVPNDLIDEVLTSGKAMHGAKTVYDRAWDDDVLAGKLRPHLRKIREFDSLYSTRMHETRRLWVCGDIAGWRDAAKQLPVIANGMSQLLESILDM